MTPVWHTGQRGSVRWQMRLAHSMQKRLWPQGTSAAITSLSKHTEQSRLPLRLVPEEVEEEEEEVEDTEEESQGTPGGWWWWWWGPGSEAPCPGGPPPPLG